MRLFVFFALLLGPLEAARRPITHEDVWLMHRVGAPVISPDGRWVVFSVVEPSYEQDKQVSDLWIVPADGSAEPRRLTSSKSAESDPIWSPDSRRIAFTAQREGDEKSQAYVLSLDGGEATRVTTLSGGARRPRWSPSGKLLAVESDFVPNAVGEAANRQAYEEQKKRKYKALVFDSFPIRSWDRWLAETKPHLVVVDLSGKQQPRDLFEGTRFAAQEGFAAVADGLGGSSLQAVWAPDEGSLVFAASTDANTGAYDFSTTHLFEISTGGGEPRPLTSGKDQYSTPVFRPDGAALYARHTRREDETLYSLSRLAIISWPARDAPKLIAEGFDRSVDGFVFSPDSRTIYLTAEEAGHDKVFVMPARGGEAKPVYNIDLGGYSGLSSAERAASTLLVANWQSMTNPPEVVRVDTAGGKHAALTRFTTARASEIDWAPPRHFWFETKAGVRIHNMLVLPPAFEENKKYPLLVFMHGGPHNMWKDIFFTRWNFHYVAAAGFVVLMTNYSGSTGFGEKFADAINRDVLRLPAGEINEAADEAIRRFQFIDPNRQAAGGASYGGYLANWMQATTTRYKALFNHAGLTNHDSMYGTTDGAFFWEKRYGGPVWEGRGQWQEQNPMRFAAHFKTPMLVSHGERDYRVPLGQALEIYKLLQRQRVPVRLIVFPEENHWILNGENNRHYFEELFAWLRRWIPS